MRKREHVHIHMPSLVPIDEHDALVVMIISLRCVYCRYVFFVSFVLHPTPDTSWVSLGAGL